MEGMAPVRGHKNAHGPFTVFLCIILMHLLLILDSLLLLHELEGLIELGVFDQYVEINFLFQFFVGILSVLSLIQFAAVSLAAIMVILDRAILALIIIFAIFFVKLLWEQCLKLLF